MGLADFLAEAGGNTVVGHVARAAGGKTIRQSEIDSFINNDLPALTDQLHKAATKEDVMKAGQALIGAGLKAGLNPNGLDKLMEMTVGPALQNLQSGELDKFRAEIAPQPAQPRPTLNGVPAEGPLTEGGNFIDPKAGRPVNEADMIRLGQITGATPAQYPNLLRTPAQIGENVAQAGAHEASQRHTEEQIRAEQNKARMIQSLSDKPIANTGVSPQALGAIGGLGQFVTQSMPTRPDALDDVRRGEILARTGAENARAGASNAAAARSGRRGSATMEDWIASGGDPRDQEGFIQFRDAGKAAGTETTADQPYNSIDREVDLATIAKAAKEQGKTSPEDIKAIAASRGIVIEGTPQLGSQGGTLGYFGTPTLTGQFEIKRKPKVTTKTKPGAAAPQGRYSQDIPTGSAPAAQAGGRGRGQSAPQRLKFDAQGNLIK